MSTTPVLNIAEFREMFSLFADPTKWPDMLLEMYWKQATCMMDDDSYGCGSAEECGTLGLYLLLCHLLTLHKNLAKGKQGGFVSSSSIDKVSVTKVAPPVSDMFDWWLGQTPFGQQLLASLLICTVGGFSVGGLPEREAFRKAYGTFE